MPFSVQDLIVDRRKPVSVRRDETAKVALDQMIANDFSQLPIVDSEEKVVGMVTSDSIVRAVNNFGVTLDGLRVSHATRPASRFRLEDDLFDLLEALKNTYAVVVVDNEDHLLGIVTNYDTADYFRRRAEDMMWVEDIEGMLKEFILRAFTNENGTVDEGELADAIVRITPTNKKFDKRMNDALVELNANGGPSLSESECKQIREVISKHLNPPATVRNFQDLAMSDYVELLLAKSRWDLYKSIFALEPDSFRKLLNNVREIRNTLAHFRAELTNEQRDQLHFCKDFLADHIDIMPTCRVADGPPEGSDAGDEDTVAEDEILKVLTEDTTEVPPQIIELETAEQSRYAPLAQFLQRLSQSKSNVVLTFTDIELIVKSQLPRAAFQHRSWWANDTVSHVQSKQWLEVGWRVASVNFAQEKVTFARIREREQRYIEFFSALLDDLKTAGLRMKSISPTGRSFMPMDNIVSADGNQITFISCSFARGARFRVELYIDTGDGWKNDGVFEGLEELKEQIQSKVSTHLEWESLEDKRASRIAAYHPGAITDDDNELAELRKWAVPTVIEFYRLFQDDLKDAILQFESESSRDFD